MKLLAHRRRRIVLSAGLALAFVGVAYALSRGPSEETLAEGRDLFVHEWEPNDPLADEGDGLGPVFNEKSCVACHFQGGVGGGGPNEKNVLTFEVHPAREGEPLRGGVVHASAVADVFQETKDRVRELFPIVEGGTTITNGCLVTVADFDPVRFTTVSTPPLFGLGLLEGISDWRIRARQVRRSLGQVQEEFALDFEGTPAGRLRKLPDGRVGRFGWKGQFATLEEFVAAACAVEVGLTNPLRPQDRARHHAPQEDARLDLDSDQFHALVAFVQHLPRPEQVLPQDSAERERARTGERVFEEIGCADCHPRNLGGVEGVYTDLLLHRIEDDRDGGGSYGRREPAIPRPESAPRPEEWKTPPLWGVADSAPYWHDGSCATLTAAIHRHGGHARHVRERFQQLTGSQKDSVLAFLRTLRAPTGSAE